MKELIFRNSIHTVSKGETVKKFLYVSNNDACEKDVGFYYENEKDIVIDGQGNTVLFNEDITGFLFQNCENIRISNLKVDYGFNAHFELKVLCVTADKIYIEQRKGFEFNVVDGTIVRLDGRKVTWGLMLPYDEIKARPAYRTGMYRLGKNDVVEGLIPFDLQVGKDDKGYYIPNKSYYAIRTGEVLVFLCYYRHNQAFIFESCKNVTLENVEIYYSPSMGIVAQMSEDIYLKNVRIKRNGNHGLISSSADATHFVNCSGEISLHGCEFFHMLDDGANFHGNYTKVSQTTVNTIQTEIKHYQQYGVNIYKEGDIVDVYQGSALALRKRIRVKASRLLSPSVIEIETEDALGVAVGDTLENAERMPTVHINNCRCGDNRPRAFLLTTPKPVIVENCEFSNCAHAIDISGDTTYWFESGRAKNILIRSNVFNVCNYNEIDYPIFIHPGFDHSKGKFYHENIRIENNIFIGITDGIVQAANVSGLTIMGNRFEMSTEYPFIKTEQGHYNIKDCQRVEIK